MATEDNPPLSPPSEKSSTTTPASHVPTATTTTVPLDSPIRTTPIHPLVPEIRVPGEPLQAHQYNPVTCAPIDFEAAGEVRNQLEELRRGFRTPAAALKEQEQAAKELKRRMEEVQTQRDRVQKDLDKKMKEMDTELKVLTKYQQVKASDIPS